MLKLQAHTLLAAGLAGLTTLLALPATAQHSGHNTPAPAASTPTPTAAAQAKTTLPIKVQSAVILAVPPSITETSAFLTLKNTSQKAVKLTGVKASIAGQAMFMKTLKQQNMTGMIPATGFVLPASGTLTLKNDGDHIMLMKLKRPLKVGEVLPIVLLASDGRSLTVKATVKKP